MPMPVPGIAVPVLTGPLVEAGGDEISLKLMPVSCGVRRYDLVPTFSGVVASRPTVT
jgi:hypothetical protein